MPNILVLAGDGIGPEITAEATRILTFLSKKHSLSLSFTNALIGGAAIDATGSAFPEETLRACKSADAILLGAVGGPQWPSSKYPDVRPEQGLLALRKELGLFANIRPCYFPGKTLIDHSPLKPHIIKDVKFTVVRELTGGIYFGQRKEETGDGFAWDMMEYSVEEITRITRIAANIALQASPPLQITSIDKANVLATSRLWRKTVTSVIEKEFPSVPLTHALVDSAAMQMLVNPRNLNGVILTENMFGDILSDEASVIPGSLGLLPSASLNGSSTLGVYEPIHGSAPDIAGLGIANPIGTILSAAMLLGHSLGLVAVQKEVEAAVEHVLDVVGLRTRDLQGTATTAQVADAILLALQ